jgi:hexosaminidase
VYTSQQLRAVVSYADTRGVTVIPELEGPGHSSAMRRSDPSFNGEGGDTPQGGGVINAANQTVYDGMATIVSEMASIFQSSPYIHVGCDETGTPPSLPGYPAFAKEHNISGGGDLFAYYVKTMADAVKKTGKTAMIWGPAALERLEPNDAVVMVWQGSDGTAAEAEKHGLHWINCPNGGSNQTAEFGRDIVDFGNTPVGSLDPPLPPPLPSALEPLHEKALILS